VDRQSGFQLAGTAPERYETFVAPIMAPFVEAVLDAAQLRPGEAVLDLACGTGFVARSAAARVGPAGRVVGLDLSAAMLAVAARHEAGGAPVEWRQASADDLPLPDASFDAVVCQQGLQFFPDLSRALAEVVRVSRDGARVVATVWSALELSPYFQAQFDVVETLLGPEDVSTFIAAVTAGGRVEQAFRTAGLKDVARREVVAQVPIPSLPTFIHGHLSAVPWGVAIAESRPDGLTAAVESMVADLAPHTEADGSMTATFASTLLSGRR
jgi:SAM-dependent methyltransferase